MVWFLALHSAHAVDLTTLVIAWEHVESGQAGSDDDDRATDAAFDSAGHVVVTGWLDGSAGSGKDALALSFDADGVERWRDVHDHSAVIGSPSDDRWYGLALDPATDETLLCGQQGASDRPFEWFMRLHTADLAEETWTFRYDEGASSPTQSCRAVDFGDTNIAAVGQTWGDNEIGGQWRTIALQRGSQPLVVDLWTFDPYTDGDVPDSPTDIKVDLGGSFVITGYEGRDGAPGSSTNDLDGNAQKRTVDGRLVWDDTWRPDDPPTLDDRFLAVALSPIDGTALAVGYENLGTDNEAGADLDGIGMLYDPVGNFGSPILEWSPEARWGGPDNQAISAAVFDSNGDAYVAGVIDAMGGQALRVAQLDPATGAELASWEGLPHDAAWVEALLIDDERVIVAGWVDDGSGPDVYVAQLGIDTDGDGVADTMDECPSDADKDEPGLCGCGTPDLDGDSDGVLDCDDGCPSDPDKLEPLTCGCGVAETDSDGDETLDCVDDCASDPDKVEPGVCGCNTPDSDDDLDGYVFCQDQCPDSPQGVEVDAVGCEIASDTGDTGASAPPADDSGGCGCTSSSSAPSLLWLLPLTFAAQLRRKRG